MTNTKLGITKDVMAHKCIPFLVPLSVENGLTIAQFNTIVALVREMFSRVEKEQREKLEQLSTINRDNKYGFLFYNIKIMICLMCFFLRPKDASEILASELEKSTLNSNNDDMFSGFSISQSSNNKSHNIVGSNSLKLNKPKEQLK